MAVIGVTNLKGGTGKSTIAQSLAAFFLGEGMKTILIDADPQSTTLMWAERAAEHGHTVPRVHKIGQADGKARAMLEELKKLRDEDKYEAIVVDCPDRKSVV